MSKENSVSNNVQHKEVIFLKLLILFTVISIPVIFIITNAFIKSRPDNVVISNLSDKTEVDGILGENEFNLSAPLPNERIGDLSNVDPEEINSLFDNLK